MTKDKEQQLEYQTEATNKHTMVDKIIHRKLIIQKTRSPVKKYWLSNVKDERHSKSLNSVITFHLEGLIYS